VISCLAKYRLVRHVCTEVLLPATGYPQRSEFARDVAFMSKHKLAGHVARFVILAAYIKSETWLGYCSVFKSFTDICNFLHSSVCTLKKAETCFSEIFIAVPDYKNIRSQDTEICTYMATGSLNISSWISLKHCGIIKIRSNKLGTATEKWNIFVCIKRNSQ
jgi:hypothetical protein